jgi:hypothetical protein
VCALRKDFDRGRRIGDGDVIAIAHLTRCNRDLALIHENASRRDGLARLPSRDPEPRGDGLV